MAMHIGQVKAVFHPRIGSMTTKKTKSAVHATKLKSSKPISTYQLLEALLRTMRAIAYFEDALCELSHELKRTSVLSSEDRNELRELLEQIPSHEFIGDLSAVKVSLGRSKTGKIPVRKRSKKPNTGKKATGTAAKKKQGRMSSK